jgi:hypothetical protein
MMATEVCSARLKIEDSHVLLHGVRTVLLGTSRDLVAVHKLLHGLHHQRENSDQTPSQHEQSSGPICSKPKKHLIHSLTDHRRPL